MAHVKLALKDDLLASDLPDQEVFAARLPDVLPDHAAGPVRRRDPHPPAAPRDRHHDAGQRSRRHRGHHRTPTGSTEDVGVGPSTRCAAMSPPTRSSGSARCGGRSGRRAKPGRPVAVTDRMTLDLRRLIDRAGRWLLNYRPQPLAVGAEINRFAEKVADADAADVGVAARRRQGHRGQGGRGVQRAGRVRGTGADRSPPGCTSTACST